jgi:carboxyl-terminal processing protease
MMRWFISLLLTPWICTASAAADQLEGQIGAVDGKTFAVVLDGDLDPQPGDALSVLVDVPGVGLAKVAEGKVSAVENGIAICEITEATGTPAIGHRVRIDSSNPIRRKKQEPPPPPAMPGETPAATMPEATPAAVPVEIPVPTETDRETIRVLARALAEHHLSAHPLDDEIAERTLKLLIDSLDKDKLYFLRPDLQSLQRRVSQFDDQLRTGDLSLAFEVFSVWLERFHASHAMYERLLEDPIDWNLDERLNKYTDFAATQEEWRERWRKQVKKDVLAQMATGADESTAISQAWRLQLERSAQVFRWDHAAMTSRVADVLCDAFDPQSAFFAQSELTDRQVELQKRMVGIGATLKEQNGYTEILAMFPDSPASLSGKLHPGDRIAAVSEGLDGEWVNVFGKSISDTVNLIRGPEGTTVRLRVLPKDSFEARIVPLVRKTVNVSQFGSAVLKGDLIGDRPTAKIGYVYLPSFYSATNGKYDPGGHGSTNDLRRALADFQTKRVDVVVLDLSNNGGGHLQESINLCGLLIGNQYKAVYIRDRNGESGYAADEQVNRVWNGPLVVLTSQQTSGGAEIVTAAIKDHRAGLVIGSRRTFGNGVTKGQFQLNSKAGESLGIAHIVTDKIYRPTGDSLQGRGVPTDVILPSQSDLLVTTEDQNPWSLAFDRITTEAIPVRSSRINESLIAQLTKNSESRRAGNHYFQVLTELEQLQAELSAKGQSLRRDTYLEERRSLGDSDKNDTPLPGIPDVMLDGRLREALKVALEYAMRK